MNSKKIRFDINSNNPFSIKLNASKNETHVLIRLTRGAHCESMNLLMLENGLMVPKNIAAKGLTLLAMHDKEEFSINANFSSAKGFIEVEVFRGSWEEILLAEVEFSFSAAPYTISCLDDAIAFAIGEEGQCRIEVKENAESGFDLIYKVKDSADHQFLRDFYIAADSEMEQVVKRLYGRIKGRVKGEGFAERQQTYLEENTKNLNATMLGSFVDVE